MPAVPEPSAAAPTLSIGRLIVEVVAPAPAPAAPAPSRVVVVQRGGDRRAARSGLLHRGFGLRQR